MGSTFHRTRSTLLNPQRCRLSLTRRLPPYRSTSSPSACILSPHCRQSGYTSCRAGLGYLRGRLGQHSSHSHVCMLLVHLPRTPELHWICLPCLQRLVLYITFISPLHSSTLHCRTERTGSSRKAEQVSLILIGCSPQWS